MGHSMTATALARHPESLQTVRPVMAKADLKKVQWRADALDCARAIKLANLTHKEAAALLDLSEQSLSNQLAGAERPQTELWRASDRLRGPYLVAQAERQPDLCDVVTTISIRRTA